MTARDISVTSISNSLPRVSRYAFGVARGYSFRVVAVYAQLDSENTLIVNRPLRYPGLQPCNTLVTVRPPLRVAITGPLVSGQPDATDFD